MFARWRSEVPARGFTFAVKGGRFLTHSFELRNAEPSLGNFFARGGLALGARTGPFLRQLPGTRRFDALRLAERVAPRGGRRGAVSRGAPG